MIIFDLRRFYSKQYLSVPTQLCVGIMFLTASFFAEARAGSETFSAARAMEQVRDEFIKPGYRNLHVQANSMSAVTRELCQSASSTSLKQTHAQFSNLVDAWGNIEMIRFGPILADNLLERVFFYPDRRASSLKRMRKILTKKEAKALDPARLAKISVAAQGLGALEYVLFGKGSEILTQKAQSYRCKYAVSIATNLQNVSEVLDRQWHSGHEFLYLWSNPGYRNPVFANDDAAVVHLISTIIHGLEVVRDTRMSAFLKLTPVDDFPKKAPLWRSSNTMRLLLANIKSVEKMYLVSNLGNTLPASAQEIAQSIENQFTNFHGSISPDLVIADALADTDSRLKLVEFWQAVDALTTTVQTGLAGTLGLATGFFFDDGD